MSILVGKRIFITTDPIRRINSLLNQAMKSRMRPVRQPFDQTMLERVDMDVIHMRTKTKFQWRLTPALSALNAVAVTKIRLVADQVFPISALPDTPFVARHANLGTPFGFWQCLGKRDLD